MTDQIEKTDGSTPTQAQDHQDTDPADAIGLSQAQRSQGVQANDSNHEGAQAQETVQAPAVTAGELIRQARTQAGLHIAALSVSMKVPQRKLEALESNRLNEFPDNTFVRALAASVCRHLKIDSKPILELLPGAPATKLAMSDGGLNTPFHKPGDALSWGETWKKIRITVLSVLALLVGAIVLFAMPEAWLSKTSSVVKLPLEAATSDASKQAKPGEVIEPVVSGVSAGTITLAPSVQDNITLSVALPSSTQSVPPAAAPVAPMMQLAASSAATTSKIEAPS